MGEETRAELQVDIGTEQSACAALQPLRELTEARGEYPLLARWAAAPSGPTPMEQLELGLRMLLDGIARRHPNRQRRKRTPR